MSDKQIYKCRIVEMPLGTPGIKKYLDPIEQEREEYKFSALFKKEIVEKIHILTLEINKIPFPTKVRSSEA